MKHLLLSFGVVLLLVSFNSCTDDDLANGGRPGNGDSDYSVRIPHDKSSYVIVLDNLTGDVNDIASDAAWLSAVQDGQDGEQHPVLQLTLTGTDNHERTANLTLKSSSSQEVTVFARKSGATCSIGKGYGASCGTVTVGGVVYPDGITASPYTYQPYSE